VAHISNLCAVNEISRESKQTQKVVTSSILPKWSVIRGLLIGITGRRFERNLEIRFWCRVNLIGKIKYLIRVITEYDGR